MDNSEIGALINALLTNSFVAFGKLELLLIHMGKKIDVPVQIVSSSAQANEKFEAVYSLFSMKLPGHQDTARLRRVLDSMSSAVWFLDRDDISAQNKIELIALNNVFIDALHELNFLEQVISTDVGNSFENLYAKVTQSINAELQQNENSIVPVKKHAIVVPINYFNCWLRSFQTHLKSAYLHLGLSPETASAACLKNSSDDIVQLFIDENLAPPSSSVVTSLLKFGDLIGQFDLELSQYSHGNLSEVDLQSTLLLLKLIKTTRDYFRHRHLDLGFEHAQLGIDFPLGHFALSP